jgi:hypothetical protein
MVQILSEAEWALKSPRVPGNIPTVLVLNSALASLNLEYCWQYLEISVRVASLSISAILRKARILLCESAGKANQTLI